MSEGKAKKKRGLAQAPSSVRSRVSRLGGIASHKGDRKGHEFTTEEARAAGRKGGRARAKARSTNEALAPA